MNHPEGRVGLRKFLKITGISRSRFFRDIRFEQRWIDFFDIRMPEDKRALSFDAEAARAYAQRSIGTRVTATRP